MTCSTFRSIFFVFLIPQTLLGIEIFSLSYSGGEDLKISVLYQPVYDEKTIKEDALKEAQKIEFYEQNIKEIEQAIKKTEESIQTKREALHKALMEPKC
jgi:hypothetical protein